MGQWIQLYSLRPKELKTILNTFQKAFPYVSVWMFSPADIIVLGSRDNRLLDFTTMEKAFYLPSIKNDLKSINITNPSDMMKGYLFGTSKARLFTAGTAINTDDLPIIEFEAPKSLHEVATSETNFKELISCC